MKALVYEGPHHLEWRDVADAHVTDRTDVVVHVEATTVCDADLVAVDGGAGGVAPGRIPGHEAVGTVVEVADAVRNVTVGDRVLVASVSACGTCRFCRIGHYGQCEGGGGWQLGRTIDGTHAEYVRVPYADGSVHAVPEGARGEELVMLAELVPTAYEVGAINAKVGPGDVVVVTGAGPVGLAAIVAAQVRGPSLVVAVDPSEARLEAAKRFGADLVVNDRRDSPFEVVHDQTGGLGADVVLATSTASEDVERAIGLVRPGGRVAAVRLHGDVRGLRLEGVWLRDVTVSTGQLHGYSIPTLLRLAGAGQLDVALFASHHFALGELPEAYGVAARATEVGAIKVVATR